MCSKKATSKPKQSVLLQTSLGMDLSLLEGYNLRLEFGASDYGAVQEGARGYFSQPLPNFDCLYSESSVYNESVGSCSGRGPQQLAVLPDGSESAVVVNDTVIFSCKHNFPFRMVKSYPKVYHSYYRQQHGSNRLSVHHDHPSKETIVPLPNKHELLRKIDLTDREIAETEKRIEMLKQSLKESPQNECLNEKSIATIQSLSERIYSENKAKAESSYRKLHDLCKDVDLSNVPLCDIEALKANKRKFAEFRNNLMKFIQRKKQERIAMEAQIIQVEADRREKWKRRLEKLESSPDQSRNEVEKLEYFEKVFPELRLDREHKEILRSATVRTRNQPYVKDYTLYLREKQRAGENSALLAASIPHLLLAEDRNIGFLNNYNNLIRDLEEASKEDQASKVRWSHREREQFREKYLEYPKNFSVISTFFKGKTVSDCVNFYYLMKKGENYKELLCLRDGRRTRGVRTERPRAAESPNKDINIGSYLPE